MGYNYPWVFSERKREERGEGDVALHIKEGIESHKVERERSSNSFTESLWVESPGLKNRLVVGTCYWPLDQNAEGALEMQKEIREESKSENIIIGDFTFQLLTG